MNRVEIHMPKKGKFPNYLKYLERLIIIQKYLNLLSLCQEQEEKLQYQNSS